MKKVRIGIVGPGNIAHRFANAAKNVANAEITAVASRTKENADAFGDKFGIPYRFSSYEDMAKSDVIDAAYIAVPHSCHIECSILMLKNKKNVICEKPLAVNQKECEEMIAAAKDNDVLLMEAMWARLVPGTLKMLEIAKSGILGDIRSAQGKFCYTMDEDEMEHHVLKNENGGGSLLDVGVYCLNFAKWYLGTEVEDISAFSDNFNNIDAHTEVLIKYKNGAIAALSSAVLLRKESGGFIYGTKGFAQLDRCYAPEKIKLIFNDGREEEIHVPYSGNGFEEQIEHFANLILSGKKESPVNTFEQSLFIANQMDKIRQKIGIKYPQDNTIFHKN